MSTPDQMTDHKQRAIGLQAYSPLPYQVTGLEQPTERNTYSHGQEMEPIRQEPSHESDEGGNES